MYALKVSNKPKSEITELLVQIVSSQLNGTGQEARARDLDQH